MSKTQAEPEERQTDGAADTAADLVQEDRHSTWSEIVRRHQSAIPKWNTGRSESAVASKRSKQ